MSVLVASRNDDASNFAYENWRVKMTLGIFSEFLLNIVQDFFPIKRACHKSGDLLHRVRGVTLLFSAIIF